MPVSPADVRDDLLSGYLGQEVLALAPAFYLSRILTDLNKALQRIYAASKAWTRETESSAVLHAPTAITGLGVTHGEKTIAGWSGVQSWMLGATVLLEGDPCQNRILSGTGLLNPYLGPTGTVNGMVYGDVVVPGNSAVQIMAPVKLIGRHDLVPTMSRAAMDAGTSQAGYGTGENRPVGVPQFYGVESYQDGAGAIRPRIRITPLPGTESVLKYSVRCGAPVYTALTSTEPIPMPGGYGDAILLPIVRQMLSSFKDFTGDKQAVKEDADEAWKTLGSMNEPQAHAAQQHPISPNW